MTKAAADIIKRKEGIKSSQKYLNWCVSKTLLKNELLSQN